MPVAVLVIPTFNERENISPLLERIAAVRRTLPYVNLQVLFVDDSSPDGTGQLVKGEAKRYGFVHLLIKPSKEGIGRAFLSGFAFALERLDPAVVIQMDADLQHPPEVIPELVRVVLDGADVVIASRKVPGGKRVGWSRRRILISWGANILARTVLGLKQKDVTTGFKAYSRRMVEELLRRRPHSSSFSYQEETLYLAKKANMRVEEIPFTFAARKKGRSKFESYDILRFIASILAIRLRPAE